MKEKTKDGKLNGTLEGQFNLKTIVHVQKCKKIKIGTYGKVVLNRWTEEMNKWKSEGT